jgi:DNA-binding CsgD family transcriptional regulator
MQSATDTLDRIARSGEAVFARDSGERIIFWSRRCEELLGLAARDVLGRHCHDVTCGRDTYGNIYCHHNCPIAFQARDRSDPVRRFSLQIETRRGLEWFDVRTFAIPSYHAELSTVVHVLREARDEERPSPRWKAADAFRDPLRPVAAAGREPAVLTAREKEILRLLAQGKTTSEIARELFISPVTVRNHVGAVLSTLNVHSRVEAVALAFRHHLVSPRSSPPVS